MVIAFHRFMEILGNVPVSRLMISNSDTEDSNSEGQRSKLAVSLNEERTNSLEVGLRSDSDANEEEIQSISSDSESSLDKAPLNITSEQSKECHLEKESPVLAPLSSTSPADVLYALRESPGKGKGLFATKPIKCGTRILAEAPLLHVNQVYYSKGDVEISFEKLSASSQIAFLDLSSCHRSDPRVWLDGTSFDPCSAAAANERSLFTIYQTNCVDISGHHYQGSAIFLAMSRINHSCVPNCCFVWNRTLQQETVHAVRDIDEGAELSVAYCNVARGKKEREEDLIGYGFVCSCQACRDAGDEDELEPRHETSDDRRYRIAELLSFLDHYDRLSPAAISDDLQRDPTKAAEEVCQLLEKEGIMGLYLCRAYQRLAKLQVENKQYEAALSAAQKFLQVNLNALGPDHDWTGGSMRYVRYVEELLHVKEGIKQVQVPES